MKSIFKNWKCRCSGLGHILSSKPGLTETEQRDLTDFQKRVSDAKIGKAKPLTAAMQTKMDKIIAKRDAPDQLPEGAKTYLDEQFRYVKWSRRRLLHNKYLDKGNICEEDGLQLQSDVTGKFHSKNTEKLENDWIIGTPDNREFGIITDIKSNYDMDSFDKAGLSSLYKWQIRAYCWLDKKTRGVLAYCLVNNPYHQLLNEKNSLYYKMGTPSDDEERFIEAKQQMERNMIFDIEAWRENYPNYDFENDVLDFDIPAILRLKRFDVTLEPEDIKFMKGRVELAREYLINKDLEENKKIEEFKNNDNE